VRHAFPRAVATTNQNKAISRKGARTQRNREARRRAAADRRKCTLPTPSTSDLTEATAHPYNMKTWDKTGHFASRLFIGLGFATRTGVLLFAVWTLGWNLLTFLRTSFALDGIHWILIRFAILILLIVWLLRRGAKHYRTWAALGCLLALCIATSPCWFEFPAQDFGPPSTQERSAIYTLKSIKSAETHFYGQFHRYGDFSEIKIPYLSTRNASQALIHFYTLTLTANVNGYILTAEPMGQQHGGYGCCIGCPAYRYFYTDESRTVRENSHCKPADAGSPEAKMTTAWHREPR
jgi:hypothetical protein